MATTPLVPIAFQSCAIFDEKFLQYSLDFEFVAKVAHRLPKCPLSFATTFAQTLFKPMLEEVAKLAKTADERAELTDYMMAKHGLERNEVMARRAAEKQANEVWTSGNPSIAETCTARRR